MRTKKIISFTSVLIILTCIFIASFMFGCARRGTEEPAYSKEVAEKILISINNEDYDSISSYFSDEFKNKLKEKDNSKTNKAYTSEKEAFINRICKPLKNEIGEYQPGTLKFERTLTEKGYTSVFYLAKFSKEKQGDVTFQLVFQEINGKMLISGMWFSSKTLRQRDINK